MHLSDLPSIISSIAVIVTLVFLLIQTRQTNRNQKALMQQGRTARWIDIILNRTTPSISAILNQASQADSTLDGSQIGTVLAQYGALFWSIEDSFLQYQSGLLDEMSWKTELSSLRFNLSIPEVRVVWKIVRQFSGGDYAAFVDTLLLEIKPQKPPAMEEIWKDLMMQEMAQAA